MINESTDDADLEAMLTNDERAMKYRRNMYRQPKVQANLMKLIPLYDQMGLFDWLQMTNNADLILRKCRFASWMILNYFKLRFSFVNVSNSHNVYAISWNEYRLLIVVTTNTKKIRIFKGGKNKTETIVTHSTSII